MSTMVFFNFKTKWYHDVVMKTDKSQLIHEVLTRGTDTIYPNREAFEQALQSGKKLRLYHGIDPTGELHLGHTVSLLKIRQLQELGHEVIVLYGDFTAMIGDPTDKLAARQPLTRKQVLQNAKNYKKLIGRILDLRKTKFKHNSKWHDKLNFADVLKLTSNFTVQQILDRDMFRKRLGSSALTRTIPCPGCGKAVISIIAGTTGEFKGECSLCGYTTSAAVEGSHSVMGQPIYLHEFLYPIMQGYDSVAMDVDLEIGGSDQLFNMMAGRTLMRKLKNKEKFVLTMKLLEDPVSGKKMGKTEGNAVSLTATPEDMFGKIMSWPDELIIIAFELLTSVPMADIEYIKKEMAGGKNPKEFKMMLASKIVELHHGAKAAHKATEQFKQMFEQHIKPSDMPTFKVSSRNIVDVLVETKLATSKSEARRLIEQGGIKVDDTVVGDEAFVLSDATDVIVQKGKRYFAKIVK